MTGDGGGNLLELLIRINKDVAGALDLRTVLQRLIFAAVQYVGGERASIIVVDDVGRPVEATIVFGTNLHEHTTRQLRETLDRGMAGWVIRNRQAALVPDTSMDERWLRRPDDAPDQSGPKAAICVPLIARNQTVGALTIVHSVPGAFGAEHMQLAQAISDQASIAVLNARLYSESTRQARIMTSLAESAASFGGSIEIRDVLERILSRTLQTLQVETAALGLLDGPAGMLVYRAAAGQNATGIVGHTAARDKGLAGEVLQKGRALVSPNAGEDARLATGDRLPGLDVRALMMAPIRAEGRAIGVLTVVNPLARNFDPDAVVVMQGLGGLAGTTIHNAQLFEALHEARRHYLELFEESLDLVFVTDAEGRITETNKQAASATGYEPERLHSMGIAQLHRVDWDRVGKDFAGLRRQGSLSYESLLEAADGRAIPVLVHVRSIEFAAANSILWTLHDLTERKQLDDLRQKLTSMIYHDLRSPLSNLRSSLDLLRTAVSHDDESRATLEIAEHSAERMSRLINSLLDINRLEAGQQLTSKTTVKPEVLVKGAVKDVSVSAEARNHVIRTDLASDLPEIHVDSDMIRRVLINLLENAIKFSNAGSEVEIGARRENNSLMLWVRDKGRGIPAAEQAHVFDKFTHLAATPDPAAGLGLGLAFCQLAVHAHGGAIRVESQEGKGATFIISLPMKMPED
ncbi:MAG TPA: GAF domain-containing protein [Anaerolineales bacterium]